MAFSRIGIRGRVLGRKKPSVEHSFSFISILKYKSLHLLQGPVSNATSIIKASPILGQKLPLPPLDLPGLWRAPRSQYSSYRVWALCSWMTNLFWGCNLWLAMVLFKSVSVLCMQTDALHGIGFQEVFAEWLNLQELFEIPSFGDAKMRHSGDSETLSCFRTTSAVS